MARTRERLAAGAVGAGFALAAGLWSVAWAAGRLAPVPEDVPVVEVPTPEAPIARTHRLARGETLGGVLGAHGMGATRIHEAVEAMRTLVSPRRLLPGAEVRLVGRGGEAPERIEIQLDRDRQLALWGEPWRARLDSVPVKRDTIVLAGLVRGNLFDAALSGDAVDLDRGGRWEVAYQLSRVYGWQIDFYRDLRAGDAYRVLLAREVRPDGSLRRAEVVAAEFRNAGRDLVVVRFDEGGLPQYYDEEGESVRGQFLLAPLDIVRVTSRFNRRRFTLCCGARDRTWASTTAPRPAPGAGHGGGRGEPRRVVGPIRQRHRAAPRQQHPHPLRPLERTRRRRDGGRAGGAGAGDRLRGLLRPRHGPAPALRVSARRSAGGSVHP